MKNIKRILGLLLVLCMAFGLVACGAKGGNDAAAPAADGEETQETTGLIDEATKSAASQLVAPTGHNEEIVIGTWWVQHYDSNDTALEDSPDYVTSIPADGDDPDTAYSKEVNRKVAELKFANVDKIEQKYNLKFFWQNLTFEGVKESINTSILAGSPDCDIYLTQADMCIPAALNGLCLDLKTILPEDADLFTDQKIMRYLDLGDGKACILIRQEAQEQVANTYPLAFNYDMLMDNGLEDPRDLYARGEWTWDKFIEYCKALTQDTDGDGQTDQYGFCGFVPDVFEELFMSNGGNIAKGREQTLTSTNVGEALQLMTDMFNTYKVWYPYDMDSSTASNTMRFAYRDGNIGFWPGAAWIAAQNADYDYDGSVGYTIPFETVYVQWPVGPSGNKDTNACKNSVSGEMYIIPVNVQEPEVVYNTLYDMWNWFDGDTSLRDDKTVLHWWYEVTAKDKVNQEANFDIMTYCGSHTTFDLWQSLGFYYDYTGIIDGSMTPAQFQETYKQQVQDGLDAYFGN